MIFLPLRRFRLVPVILVLAATGSAAPGEEPAAARDFDIARYQSPAKPAPKWLRIVDQGALNPALRGYRLPEGVRVDIVAQEPVVINPVGMTFANDGTPYVLEWRAGDGGKEKMEEFVYKDGTRRSLLTMKKNIKDVVKTLRDTKKSGTYDAGSVVLEEELPSSILLHDGWLYLTGRGTVRRYKQSQPSGPYDVKEVIAQGFCAFHHHQVSGLTIGNDGWLYVTAGDNDNFVEGSDGSRTTVLRTGGVFRMRPDGAQVQTFAIGFRNPYRDVAFDAAGNIFHADNDNEDGSKFTGCRIMHIPEGADFGWRLKQGARCCVPDAVRGAVFGELPGKLPALCKTGRGAPAGLLIYNDSYFPENFRGLLYYPDVYRRLIRAYKVEKTGASFAITEEFEFMKSDDPLFRPCQMLAGPDGAIYVVDWRTDSGGAGRLSGDGANGRIYRLTWSGTESQPALPRRTLDSRARLLQLGDADLVAALTNPDASDRHWAQEELRRRGDRNRGPLLKLLQNDDAALPARVAALGVLDSFWNDDVAAACTDLLISSDSDLRRLAIEALGWNSKTKDPALQSLLLKHLGDPDPAVRRSVAVAMGRVGGPGAADALANALAFDETDDVYWRDGLMRAIEMLGAGGIDALVALAESGDSKNLQKVIEAFQAFRTRPAAAALTRLLGNPHLSALQRAELVRSCSNYLLDPPASLEHVFAYLQAHPNESDAVKLAGLEVLASGGYAKDDRGPAWVLSLLDESAANVRVTAIKTVAGARIAAAVPKLVNRLQRSDLAANEKLAAIQALGVLGDKHALVVLRDVLAKSADGADVQAEALRSLAALDASEGAAVARRFAQADSSVLRNEAVRVLGSDPEGARLVARLFLEDKLPREYLPRVYDALRKHAAKDAEAAQLLEQVMKRGLSVANNPVEVARVRMLVATKGNPERGKSLYLNSKALACITCHRMEGVGGNVGPDLTRLWDTHSVEKIMESILEPGKEIKEGYQTFVATTNKGQVFSGLKVSQNSDEVVLRDANAKEIRIATKDIAELSASKQSLMPDNVIGQLTYDQFIDLVAFLKDRRAQESLRALVKDPTGAGK